MQTKTCTFLWRRSFLQHFLSFTEHLFHKIFRTNAAILNSSGKPFFILHLFFQIHEIPYILSLDWCFVNCQSNYFRHCKQAFTSVYCKGNYQDMSWKSVVLSNSEISQRVSFVQSIFKINCWGLKFNHAYLNQPIKSTWKKQFL